MPKVARFTAWRVMVKCGVRLVFQSEVTGAIYHSYISESLVK
jgi:hypothetical protein